MSSGTKKAHEEEEMTLEDRRKVMEKNMVTYLIRAIRMMQLFHKFHPVTHAVLDQNIREQLQKKHDLDEEYKELFGRSFNYPTLDAIMDQINQQTRS